MPTNFRETQPAAAAPIAAQRGFTLIEVMVVIVILGILATIVVNNVMGRSDEARLDAAKIQVLSLQDTVDMYKLKNLKPPEDWQQLLEKDSTGNAYLKGTEPPVDPWNNEYLLKRNDHNQVIVTSMGPDGQEGTEDDIDSENARNRKK